MGAIKIHRGNDAPLQLMVVRGDGVLEDYAGVSELSVQFVKNGARWVTVEPTAPIVAVNSGVNVIVPADTPVGDYRAIVKYRRGDRRYLAENCHAIDVIECVEEATTDDTVSVDVTLRVQFSADGKDGLSAYELAVLNGEYTGDYDGYQRWLARYAENTANEAVNIANKAKENSSTALSTAQQASVVANDAKTALATKQDTLTLTVKDNGNIVIGNIQGQAKEFMPATPSGDPNHYMYEKCGAVWNSDTRYWELNGLTDMTNEDMRDSYLGCNMYSDILLAPEKYISKRFRTNILGNVRFIATVSSNSAVQTFRDNSSLEILNLQLFNGSTSPLYILNNMSYCFDRCVKLNTILGIIKCTNALFYMAFNRCYELTNIKLFNVSNAISFADSPKLSKESLLYLINNAGTSAFPITLHADTYAWASVDEDIQAALAEKTNITLQSA